MEHHTFHKDDEAFKMIKKFSYPHEINLHKLKNPTSIKEEPVDFASEDDGRVSHDQVFADSLQNLNGTDCYVGTDFTIKKEEEYIKSRELQISDEKYYINPDGRIKTNHDENSIDAHNLIYVEDVKNDQNEVKTCTGNVDNGNPDVHKKLVLERKMKSRQKQQERKTFNCQICKKHFKYSRKLRTHLDKHHACNNTFNIYGKSFTTSEGQGIHEKKHAGMKEFLCEICDKRFLGSSAYVTHKRIHTGEKPFTCKICGKNFSDPSNFGRHRKTHTGLKPHICSLCEQSFTRVASLTRHYKNVHNAFVNTENDAELKPLDDRGVISNYNNCEMSNCTICERKFANVTSLRIHMVKHATNKSHTCETCGKGLCNEQGLKSHMKIHADNRPFVCEICSAAFTERRFLTRHMKIHSEVKPFQCVTCLKRFARSSCLRVHERIHSGEKPFQCDACGQRFAASSNACKHQRSCTGKKQFSCERCKKGFTVESCLNNHYKKCTLQ